MSNWTTWVATSSSSSMHGSTVLVWQFVNNQEILNVIQEGYLWRYDMLYKTYTVTELMWFSTLQYKKLSNPIKLIVKWLGPGILVS